MEAAVPLMASATDYEVAASQQQSDIFLILSLITVVSSAVFLLRWTRRQGRPPCPRDPSACRSSAAFSLEPDLHRYFARLARAYGPDFSLRLGTRLYVVLSSPAAVREVLKDHDVIFANHDPPASTTTVPRAQHGLLWSPHGTLWRTLRKVTVREFIGGGSRNEAVRSLLRREVRRAIARLRAREGSRWRCGAGLLDGTQRDDEHAVGAVGRRRCVNEVPGGGGGVIELLGRPMCVGLLSGAGGAGFAGGWGDG
ncbi:unnamed protein product [Musa acuminata subsp. burmannicoides]